MEKTASLREQLEAFKNGQIMDSNGEVDTFCSNFYDWFCKETSLRNKAIRLYRSVQTFVKNTPSLDTDKVYVFFKNNCPVLFTGDLVQMNRSLYDSFSICDRESGEVIFWVTPKSGHTGKAEIYFAANGFESPTKQADTFRALFTA